MLFVRLIVNLFFITLVNCEWSLNKTVGKQKLPVYGEGERDEAGGRDWSKVSQPVSMSKVGLELTVFWLVA